VRGKKKKKKKKKNNAWLLPFHRNQAARKQYLPYREESGFTRLGD
jgi:hypothetical protein